MLMRNRILAVLTCVFVGSACSDNGDNGNDEGIPFGALMPLTGALKPYGAGFKNAAILAADEINAAGGVLGQKIKLEIINTKSEPDVATSGAKTLVDKGALVILGPAASSSALKVIDAVTAQTDQLPVISASATASELTNHADKGLFWRTIASDAFQGKVAADHAITTLGVKSAAIIYVDNAYGKGLAGEFKAAFEQAGGTVDAAHYISYKEMTSTEIDKYTFDSEVSQALAGKPELIYMLAYQQDGAKLTVQMGKQFASSGHRPKLMGADGVFDNAFFDSGDTTVIEGMVGTTPTPPTTDPSFTTFSAAYKAKWKADPPLFAESTYDSVYLAALALVAGGKLDSASILQNLKAVSGPDSGGGDTVVGIGQFSAGVTALKAGAGIDYNGASGKIDWDDKGDVTSGTYKIWEVKKDAASGKLTFETVKIKEFPAK